MNWLKLLIIFASGMIVGVILCLQKMIPGLNIGDSKNCHELAAVAPLSANTICNTESQVDRAESKGSAEKASAPSDSKSEVKLRDLHSIESAFYDQFFRGNLEQSEKVLSEMEKYSRNSKIFLEAKSRFHLRKQELELARQYAKECINIDPNAKECLISLATSELSLGSLEDKERAANLCLSRAPNEPQCLNIMAIVKGMQGKPQESAEIYQHLLKNNGEGGIRFPDSMLHSSLAHALAESGRVAEALKHYDSACSDSDTNACQLAEELKKKHNL